MSIQSRIVRGIGFGAIAVATLGLLDSTPTPVNEVIWTQGAHGGGGASNGQAIPYDWRSIDDLFKTDKQAALLRRIHADDEVLLSVIMSAITEDMM